MGLIHGGPSAGGTKELYFSNAGMLNLDDNTISPEGGLEARCATAMGMQPNLLPKMALAAVETKAESAADTGADDAKQEVLAGGSPLRAL